MLSQSKDTKIKTISRIPPPEAIICCNGTIPSREFFTAFDTLPIIATDGAGLYLIHELNVIPSIVIGDFDSSSPEQFPVPTLYDPSQEYPDFEKALRYALTQQYRSLIIVGLHGEGFDHTLNNWSIYARYSMQQPIWIYDHNQFGIALSHSFCYTGKPKEIISIIPQTSATITTYGLRWNLVEEELRFGIREGARNEAIGETVVVQIHNGTVLFFVPAHLPEIPYIEIVDVKRIWKET